MERQPQMSKLQYHGVDRHVGNTPLIRLRRLSELTGCEILGKAEFMNPGGSVKDRAALGIIQDAEARGLLKPGGTIVEGTAGNTGIGLTIIGHARGYHSVIVIPENSVTGKNRPSSHAGRGGPHRAGETLFQSGKLQSCRPADGGGKGLVLGQPVRQHRKPLCALPHHWPGNLGSDRRGRSAPLFPPSVPAGRWPEPRCISKSAIRERHGRLRRPLWRGHVVVVYQRKHGNQRRRFVCRRHRPGPRDQES